MQIKDYVLSPSEENRVLAIYNKLKASFPDVKFDYRGEIIGIGEEGYYLLCYFSLNDGGIAVKFKNKTFRDLNDSAHILIDLEETVALFKSKSFKLKRPRENEERKPIRPKEQPVNVGYEYVNEELAAYTNAMRVVKKYDVNAYFDACSNRLKHSLYRNHIFSTRDLLDWSPDRIMKIENLGRKSFKELCDFLVHISKDTAGDTEDFSCPNEIQEKIEKINCVKKLVKELTVKLEDSLSESPETIEKCNDIYIALIDNVCAFSNVKLTPREQDILFSRLGINTTAKTLQEIGKAYSFSRERARQIVNKAIKKLSRQYITSDELLTLEYKKAQIVSDIAEISVGRFLSFLFTQDATSWLVKFVCDVYLHCEVDVSAFKQSLLTELKEKKHHEARLEKALAYNSDIHNMISFSSKKRCITENDFDRLKAERATHGEAGEIHYYSFDGKAYLYDSILEQRILQRLLVNNTFRRIKTQSLKIPYNGGYYYPDFQCLTHDGEFVIIEVKSLLGMCESSNIKKFEALKEYCEKYGFGYMIIDERGNSYEHINDRNEEFFNLVLAEIKERGSVSYERYQQIYKDTEATIKNLLTLIKTHKLCLSFPFLLES